MTDFGDVGQGLLDLRRLRVAGEDGAVELAYFLFIGGRWGDFLREFVRLLTREGVVHHPERLLGRRGFITSGDVVVGVRKVERAEDGREVLPVDYGVDGPPRRAEIGSEVKGLATELRLELARDGQDAITHGFEIRPATMHAPEQAVLGVLGQASLMGFRRLTESRRGHEGSNKFLSRPLVGDEARGQSIEERRVSGRRRADAEVAGGLDQGLAKDLIPHAVDHHAGRQWIVGIGDGFGELEAPAAPLEVHGLTIGGKDFEVVSRDILARAARIAAQENVAVHGLGFVDHCHGPRRALGAGFVGFDFADQATMLLRVGNDVRAHEAIGSRGGGAVRGFDKCTPRFELQGGVAAGSRQELAVDSDEFVELCRHLFG